MTGLNTSKPGKTRLTPSYKRRLRTLAEQRLEQLLTLLDALDGDPDYEPYLAQSLGNAAQENQFETWGRPALEGDDNEDREPATAYETIAQSSDWFGGGLDDCEPSLGSSNGTNQINWASPNAYPDAEEACEDEGGQCEDEGIDTDSEPNADDLDTSWAVTPFALDQTGAQWAYGETKPRRDGSVTR